MKRARSPYKQGLIWLGLGLLILILVSLGLACARGGGSLRLKQEHDRSGSAMQDEKAATSEGFAMAPMEAPAAEAAMAPGSTNVATSSTGAPLGTAQPANGNAVSFNFDDWLMPKAFAAEAIPDARYLIRNGDLALNVESYEKTAADVGQVAEKHQGIVTDSSMEKFGDGTRTGWIKVRVPAEEFLATWEELKGLGEVENQHISSQDVSTQYISTVSRLKVLHTEQETLRTMLQEALDVQRTRGLGEAYSVLLQTQERLSEVSYEIQNHEDSLAQLADQITNSTITVNLTEQAAYVADEWNWGYNETLANAQKDLRLKWRGFVQGIIYFFVSGWTALIPWALLLLIGWFIYKRIRAARAKRSSTAQGVKARKPPVLPPDTEGK